MHTVSIEKATVYLSTAVATMFYSRGWASRSAEPGAGWQLNLSDRWWHRSLWTPVPRVLSGEGIWSDRLSFQEGKQLSVPNTVAFARHAPQCAFVRREAKPDQGW